MTMKINRELLRLHPDMYKNPIREMQDEVRAIKKKQEKMAELFSKILDSKVDKNA